LHSLLDDHLDGALAPQVEAEISAHIAGCAECAALQQRAWRLHRSLQALPVPPSAPQYAERVLARAIATRAPERQRSRRKGLSGTPLWTAAGALVATLMIAVGLWSRREPAPVHTDTLPVARIQPAVSAGVQPVRLVFRSDSALSDVTIELDLPDGVELAGYPGQRRLVWQSNLQAGSNLLELPLLLHGPGGVLTATLNHGAERRRFAVQVVAAPGPHAALTVSGRVTAGLAGNSYSRTA
jgi:anti-sigma factor RsiW